MDLYILVQQNHLLTDAHKSNNGKPKSILMPPTHASQDVTSQSKAPVNGGQLNHSREKKKLF